MITEFFLKIVLLVPRGFIEMLPVLDFDFVVGNFEPFLVFLDYAAYFLPIPLIVTMFMIIVAEELFKIILSFLKMALKLLPIPFVG